MNEFSREVRYTVIKHSQLTKDQNKYLKDCISGEGIPTVESVVVEYDWPEYHLVWAMLAHRMAGKPVPNFDLWREAEALKCRLESIEAYVTRLVKCSEGQDSVATGYLSDILDKITVQTNNEK